MCSEGFLCINNDGNRNILNENVFICKVNIQTPTDKRGNRQPREDKVLISWNLSQQAPREATSGYFLFRMKENDMAVP